MNFGHKQAKSVRAYLLGRLNETEADALEESYFVEPAFLDFVKEVERRLILEYLNGDMSADDRGVFEERYLTVPALRQRLEEVRADRPVAAATREPDSAPALVSRYAFALSLAGLAVVGVVTYLAQSGTGEPGVIVRLAPGVQMSSSSRMMPEFALPAAGRVRLALEYPSATRLQPDPALRLLRIGNDGAMKPVWSSPGPVAPVQESGMVVYTAEVDHAALTAGDYLMELVSGTGERLESYVFRLRAERGVP